MSEVSEESNRDTDARHAEDAGRADAPGLLDQALAKAVSRKLLVFITATSLLVWSTLDPETWGMIAMVYIGGQSAIDFAKTWKGIS